MESPRGRITDSTSTASTSTSCNTSSDSISKLDCAGNTKPEVVDPLEVSRFPLYAAKNIVVNKIQEVKLVQLLLKEIKFVQSFDEEILQGQRFYWLYTNNITDENTRARIKSTLETHCLAPMRWVSSCEFEINIDPRCKLEKVSTKKPVKV